MKSFSGQFGLAVIVGTVSLLSGCQSQSAESVASAPPKSPPPPPKAVPYADFTVVKQPESTSKLGRGGWPQIVLGVPAKYIPATKPPEPAPGPGKSEPAPPKPLGTAKIVDDSGHSAFVGDIEVPGKDETETNLHLTRGFSWHWSHPKLVIQLTGEAPKILPLKDLPEPEVVELPAPVPNSPLTCEIIPSLAEYGIYGGNVPKPGKPDAGLLLTGKSGIGPEQDHDISYQAFLQDTQSAARLGFQFQDVDSGAGLPVGSKFVPFRFAEATKVARIQIRKTTTIIEKQDITFPGCKLYSKFNSTNFQVEKAITVKGSNGWSFTLPAQHFGPAREARKDNRMIEIIMTPNAPAVESSTPEPADESGGGRRRGRAMDRLRGQDLDREKRSVAIELLSPTPSELGLANLWIAGKSYPGQKTEAPVKFGDLTLRLRISTTTVKELGVDSVTIPVIKTSRHASTATTATTKPVK